MQTEPVRILTRERIEWGDMSLDQREVIDSVCCVCGKPIKTEREFSDNSICTKACAIKCSKKVL